MIGDAISYPTQHDDWLKIILIGGALLFFSFLIIPAFIIYGYQIRVLRCAAEDGQVPPAFGEWGDLIVDGLKNFAITIGYMIVPYLILILGGMMESALGGVILLLGLVLQLLAVFSLPVALTNFALTDSIGEAFDISTVANAAFTGEYLVAFILAFIVFFVFYIIGALTMILFFAGLFVLFYGIIVANYIFAQGCGPALRQDGGEEFAT